MGNHFKRPRMDDLAAMAIEVAKLSALLNDRHPNLKSWKWLVEHQCVIVLNYMEKLNLLDEEVDD